MVGQRKRSSTDSDAVQPSKTPRSRTPSADREKDGHPVSQGLFSHTTPKPVVTTSNTVSTDYVRDAVLCMLRRTAGNNLSSLSSYLENYFPRIPEQCRIPIVVAAFAAAQKVAATATPCLRG